MMTLNFTPEITDDLIKVHEQVLVPAIYAQWASRVAEIAEIELGQHVLDVACGTGTLARAVKLETGLTGRVVGLDASEKMLESAHRQSSKIEWQLGDAAMLPFEDHQFDRVMCQFSLMFIANRVATIKEMIRVCKMDGLVVLATWGPLLRGGAYDVLIQLVSHFCGAQLATKLAVPWALGKPGVLDALILSSGANEYECHERVGKAHYPSLKLFIETHLQLTGEFDKLDDQTFGALLNAAHKQLHAFLTPSGQLVAQLNANIFTLKAG